MMYMLDYEKKDFESSYLHSREGDNVDELDMQFDKKIGALKRERMTFGNLIEVDENLHNVYLYL